MDAHIHRPTRRGPYIQAALILTAAMVVVGLTGCSSSDVDQTTPGDRNEFDGITQS